MWRRRRRRVCLVSCRRWRHAPGTTTPPLMRCASGTCRRGPECRCALASAPSRWTGLGCLSTSRPGALRRSRRILCSFVLLGTLFGTTEGAAQRIERFTCLAMAAPKRLTQAAKSRTERDEREGRCGVHRCRRRSQVGFQYAKRLVSGRTYTKAARARRSSSASAWSSASRRSRARRRSALGGTAARGGASYRGRLRVSLH